VDWTVQPYGAGGANLIGRHQVAAPRMQPGMQRETLPGVQPGVLLYSHLDTSMDGTPEDVSVSGRTDPVGPLRVGADGVVDGFGLGVARAPAAAALLGFAELADPTAGPTLLLVGSGTHRRGTGETGIEAYLAAHPRPSAAVIAKASPVGILWSEPGAAYLTVQVRGRQGAVLAREAAQPSGGLIVQAGTVMAALEAWRRQYRADAARPGLQIGPEVGIGAIRAGWWDKPDLLPATLELGLYAVTMPGEDVPALARALQSHLQNTFQGGPLAFCDVEVAAQVVHAAATTSPTAPIVTHATTLWTKAFGPPSAIRGWTGSTDGVVLRDRGIDTVRLGPQIAASVDDARRDTVHLDDLAPWPPLYAALLMQS
jgi:acetylornithine deacetylase/succinyl-diaminopimelate desuccinylase-like protein